MEWTRQFIGGTAQVTANAWPLRSSLELGALPTAVPCARLHARHLVWEWGLDGLAESTELLVSELVTNAVKATAGQGDHAAVRLQLFGMVQNRPIAVTNDPDVLRRLRDGLRDLKGY
jgi:hypothetical protein